MKIEIKESDNRILHYQAVITERLEESDNFHRIDKVTSSPEFLTATEAREWLIEYLSLDQ